MHQGKGFKKWKFVAFFAVVVGLLSAIAHMFNLSTIEPKDPICQTEKTDSIVEEIIEEPIIEEDFDEDEEVEDSCIDDSEFVNSNIDWFAQSKVWSYPECFPDSNSLQLSVAEKWGVRPMAKREEVYVEINQNQINSIMSSPYYVVDDLTHSMPYLVPRAQLLLNTIGINFVDSLASKGMKLHIPIVTSALRTSDDIKSLQRGNRNSVSNSCHCYGTTIDITYNRFASLDHKKVSSYDDKMKKVLAEVLFDLRMEGKCYVKYERKQSCFHLTVR